MPSVEKLTRKLDLFEDKSLTEQTFIALALKNKTLAEDRRGKHKKRKNQRLEIDVISNVEADAWEKMKQQQAKLAGIDPNVGPAISRRAKPIDLYDMAYRDKLACDVILEIKEADLKDKADLYLGHFPSMQRLLKMAAAAKEFMEVKTPEDAEFKVKMDELRRAKKETGFSDAAVFKLIGAPEVSLNREDGFEEKLKQQHCEFQQKKAILQAKKDIIEASEEQWQKAQDLIDKRLELQRYQIEQRLILEEGKRADGWLRRRNQKEMQTLQEEIQALEADPKVKFMADVRLTGQGQSPELVAKLDQARRQGRKAISREFSRRAGQLADDKAQFAGRKEWLRKYNQAKRQKLNQFDRAMDQLQVAIQKPVELTRREAAVDQAIGAINRDFGKYGVSLAADDFAG